MCAIFCLAFENYAVRREGDAFIPFTKLEYNPHIPWTLYMSILGLPGTYYLVRCHTHSSSPTLQAKPHISAGKLISKTKQQR